MTPDCEQLDAYLLGDLPSGEAARFESHLEVCSACREAIDEHRWIDGLLQSPARTQLEPVPQKIVDSVRTVAARYDRRRRILTYAFATAAALLVAVGWLAFNPPVKYFTHQMEIAEPRRAPVNKTAGTFVATSDAIVVPLDSPSDDVTIVQVYQTTESERQWRLDRTLSNISTKPNGG
jgi:anti-sigma factor RsiW